MSRIGYIFGEHLGILLFSHDHAMFIFIYIQTITLPLATAWLSSIKYG